MEIVVCGLIGVVFCTPGARLFGLWLRSRKMPEGLLAVFFLGFGFAIPVALYTTTHTEESFSLPLRIFAISSQVVAMSAFALFTRLVFRPRSSLAIAVSWIVPGFYLFSSTFRIVSGNAMSGMHWTIIFSTVVAMASIVWAFVECVLYYQRMSRQVEMGIGDPVVCNRFLLWAVWTGSFISLPAVTLAVRLYLIAITPAGETATAAPAVLNVVRGVIVAGGLVTSGSMLLSFFPPASYTRWLRARTSRA